MSVNNSPDDDAFSLFNQSTDSTFSGRGESEMVAPYFERVLLVAGDQDTGKSTQLRSMFLDPRISDHRIGPKRTVPVSRNIPDTYELSETRSLYLRLTSPHENNESPDEFFSKIKTKAVLGRWCVAAAVQVSATLLMPDLVRTVTDVEIRLSPERIRVAILSPDRHGTTLTQLNALLATLRASTRAEVMVVDARDRARNGLLLADTFDFT